MTGGTGVLSLLVGVLGAVLIVLAVLRGGHGARRRLVGMSGTGLLLLGLSLSGVVHVVARALAVFSFSPLRWAGLVLAVVGLLMLSSAGLLPRRRGDSRQTESGPERRHVGKQRGKPADPVDDDLADIEAILRRRGIE